MPFGVTCWRGQDANGAHVLLARPQAWNGRLLVHVHGGPRMAPPRPTTSDEDLQRFPEFVAEGWAFAASSRRAAGFGVTRGAEDADGARRMATDLFGPPRLTVLHGQSFGGAVAAKAIEALNEPGPDGRRPWDAALLTSAVLAGPTRAYDMRIDLRAAFQAVCGTHPAPEEAPYPLGLGLAPGQQMAREEVVARLQACTGADRPAAERTEAQARAAADLSAASRVPEAALAGHLWWATQIFADISRNVTDGRSPFGNIGVVYRGTSDDAAFNARVPRVAADPVAVAILRADGDPTGRVAIPVLNMHGLGDATVFVEHQSAYRETLEAAGNGARLAQVTIDEAEHNKMSPVLYAAAIGALADWAEGGHRPGPAEFLARCEGLRGAYQGECRVVLDRLPQAWEERVNPRGLRAMAGR